MGRRTTLPNETDTTVPNKGMDETQELPAFPARYNTTTTAESDDHPVPAQYKALQEAQFLHEETLRQLRDEIQSQRQQISDLAEGQQETSQPPARLDVILLRLSELERKIGEDAPDPLLNEIVHRLAVIENGPGFNSDGRIEKLAEQLAEVRRRTSTPTTDPRTDEMALRIASVEGSVRRAQEAFQSDTLTDQIEVLQAASRESSEKVAAELSELSKQLAEARSREQPDWSSRLDSIENRLGETSNKENTEELTSRLTQLEQSEAASISDSRFDAVAERIEEIDGRLSSVVDSTDLAELQEKLLQLETQLSAPIENPQQNALSSRLDLLQSAVEDRPASETVEAIQERLSSLEQQHEQSADPNEAVAELRQRCDSFSERLSTLTEREVFENRVSAVEAQIIQVAASSPDLEELRQKLADLEDAPPAEPDGRLAELTARLRALELRSENPAQDDGRLERLSGRLDQLELTGGSSGFTNQLNELRERVVELGARPDDLSNEDSDRLLAGVTERLALIESLSPATLERLDRLEESQATTDGGDHADAMSELRQRVDQIVNSSGSTDTATSDVIHEIGLRVQALERGTGGGPASPDPALTAEFEQRIESLESQLKQTAGAPRAELQKIIERLSYLEHAGASAGSGEGEGGGPSPQIMDQLISRYEEIDGRLALIEEAAPGEASAEKNLQWVSSAMEEISEIRQQLAEVQESGTGGSGISEKFVGKLAEKISSGIAGSEVKSIQTQMYVVYFVLAVIGALTLLPLTLG